ncbi:MAG: nickel pincer cofactor biosynthesis protein LarC [Acidimicrobiales bacterium]
MTGHSLWLDPGFGASGDMLLGTLVGLGAPLDDVVARLERLGVEDWSITESIVSRCGLGATRVEVTAAAHEHGRPWSEIDRLLAHADLSDGVRTGARRTFRLLGEIEAEAHGVTIDEVHFHEVGAVDAIVDIVGVWIAVDLLGLGSVAVGPVGLGHGTVKGAHGVLPLPAPATAALLAGAPVRPVDVAMETCTPTGAALLATLGTWGPMPEGRLLRSARGAGGRDTPSHPNVVTGHLLDTDPDRDTGAAGTAGPASEPAVILETNLDDVTPEVLGYLIDRLLEDGAADAWVTPIVMKKSRPAHQLSVLTTPERAAALRDRISVETGTLGVRAIAATKYPLERSTHLISLLGHEVRIKLGPHGAKPEHDDLVAVAQATGQPLRSLTMQALGVWRDISNS